MRLLLTNDDSIESIFLHELIHALKEAGHELLVVAPKREQSWIGAAKSRHRPVASEVVDCGFGCHTWVVDGTPSDCVNIGLAHLVPPHLRPDGVISGMNMGCNLSLAFILASGTIGGAWEGALHGLPAVAVSQDLTSEAFDALKKAAGKPEPTLHAGVKISAAHAARLAPELIAATGENQFTVHNLNFPYLCTRDAAVRKTVPARVVVPGLFSPVQDDGTHRFVFALGEDVSPAEPLTDRAAIAAGYISHTVLDYRRLGM